MFCWPQHNFFYVFPKKRSFKQLKFFFVELNIIFNIRIMSTSFWCHLNQKKTQWLSSQNKTCLKHIFLKSNFNNRNTYPYFYNLSNTIFFKYIFFLYSITENIFIKKVDILIHPSKVYILLCYVKLIN